MHESEFGKRAQWNQELHHFGTSLIDQRDRVLILLGFARAFRRSELAQLRLADITETEDGLRVRFRQSKTDQESEGFVKGIPYRHEHKTCPVHAWKVWKEAAGITDGYVFWSITRNSKLGLSLSDRAVTDMIKRRAKAAGLEYAEFSGHSLRVGPATAAVQAGVSERVIAKQTYLFSRAMAVAGSRADLLQERHDADRRMGAAPGGAESLARDRP